MQLRYRTPELITNEVALPPGYLLAIGADIHLPYIGARPLLASYESGCWQFAPHSEWTPFQAQLVGAAPSQGQLRLVDNWPIEVFGQDGEGRFVLPLGQAEELVLNASPTAGVEIYAGRRRIAHWRRGTRLWHGWIEQEQRFKRIGARLIIQPALISTVPLGPRSRLSAFAERELSFTRSSDQATARSSR